MPVRVIVALDFDSAHEARALVDKVGPRADAFKIGLQLLTSAGRGIVRDLAADGRHVFLDLKRHEIPNSVAGAVRAAGSLGASMVTVHASAGSAASARASSSRAARATIRRGSRRRAPRRSPARRTS